MALQEVFYLQISQANCLLKLKLSSFMSVIPNKLGLNLNISLVFRFKLQLFIF